MKYEPTNKRHTNTNSLLSSGGHNSKHMKQTTIIKKLLNYAVLKCEAGLITEQEFTNLRRSLVAKAARLQTKKFNNELKTFKQC